MQYYEDMPVGLKSEGTAEHLFTAEEIKSFAAVWDPMPFHLDEEIAKATPIGALFASSVHILSAGVKLTHAGLQEETAVIAALGWQDIRFPQAVRAGDRLRLSSEVVEQRESRSQPDRGIVTSLNRLINQHGEVAAEYKIVAMVARRPV